MRTPRPWKWRESIGTLRIPEAARSSGTQKETPSACSVSTPADSWSQLLRLDDGTLCTAEQNWILPRGYPGFDMRADIAGSKGSMYVSFRDDGLLLALDQGTIAEGNRWVGVGLGKYNKERIDDDKIFQEIY